MTIWDNSANMKVLTLNILVACLVSVSSLASNSSSIDGKIINGTDVDAVNIKYMASITQHFPNINRYYHFCAGFLITQRHILTTYICIVQIYENGGTFLQNIAVFLGVSEVNFEKPPSSESFERPRYIAYAADYKPLEQMHVLDIPIYGIGIAILSQAAELDLANKVLSNEFIWSGKQCQVAGWGLQEFTDSIDCGEHQRKISQIEIETESDNYCRDHFPGYIYRSSYIICGKPREGIGKTMAGDYGGPLIHRKHIVGIAIPSNNTALAGPSYFLRISAIISHIEKWIGKTLSTERFYHLI